MTFYMNYKHEIWSDGIFFFRINFMSKKFETNDRKGCKWTWVWWGWFISKFVYTILQCIFVVLYVGWMSSSLQVIINFSQLSLWIWIITNSKSNYPCLDSSLHIFCTHLEVKWSIKIIWIFYICLCILKHFKL